MKSSLSAPVEKALSEINHRLENLEKKFGNTSQASFDWYDAIDICRILKISRRTFDRYRKSGLIPASKLFGKPYCRITDINNLLETNLPKNTESQ